MTEDELIKQKFKRALQIHKERLRTERVDRWRNDRWKSVSRYVNHCNNNEFFKTETYLVHLLTFTRELGFDVTQLESFAVYSKNIGWWTSLPEKKNYKLKLRVLRHFLSRYENISSFYIYDKETKKWKRNPEVEEKGLTKKQYLVHSANPSKDKLFKYKRDILQKSSRIHNTIALPEYSKRSNIICLDIDTHSININSEEDIEKWNELSNNIRTYLTKTLNLKVVLFEKSKVYRGIHIFIQLENVHNKKTIEGYLKEILRLKFDVSIDIRSKTKPIRVPFSWDYIPINIKTGKVINSITKLINETLTLIDKPIYESNVSITERLKREKNKFLYAEIDKKVWIWNRREDENGIPVTNGFYWDTYFTAGNRVGGDGLQWKLAFLCIKFNKPEYEFTQLSMQYKGSSKDLNSWNYSKIHKECHKIYQYAKRAYRGEIQTERHQKDVLSFYSNSSLVSKKEEKILNSLIYKIEFSSYKHWNRKSKEEARIVFKEILGSMKYQSKYKRKVKGFIKELKRKELEIGFQFSDEFFKNLKVHYKLSMNPKKIFSIFKCQLLELFIHKNGTSYIPALQSVKQYIHSSKYEFLFNNRNIININIINNNKELAEKYTIMCYRLDNRKTRSEDELKRRKVCGDGLGIT